MLLSSNFSEGPQRAFLRIGNAGCYFLCLARGLEPNSVLKLYSDCVKAQLITEDCYVLDPVAVLKRRGVSTSSVEKTKDPASIKGAKLAIAHLSPNHFVVVQYGERGVECVYDPYEQSHSLAVGEVSSFRVFR